MDWEETEEKRAAESKVEEDKKAKEEKKVEDAASVGGKLIRFDGPMKPLEAKKAAEEKAKAANGAGRREAEVYDEDEDPSSMRKLDVEAIVLKDGLKVYKDQAGRLWTGLATYWIKRGEFERVRLSSSCSLSFARAHTRFPSFTSSRPKSPSSPVSPPSSPSETSPKSSTLAPSSRRLSSPPSWTLSPTRILTTRTRRLLRPRRSWTTR